MALDGLDLVPPGGLQRELHLGLAHAGPREGAVVVDVEHIGAGLGDEPGKLGEGARAVAEHHGQAHEAAVLDEPALDDAGDEVDVDVAARDHEGDRLPGEGHPLVHERGERHRARPLDHGLLDLEQEEDRIGDLLLVDADHLVHVAARQVEGVVANPANGDAVGDGAGGGHHDALAGSESGLHPRHLLRLDTDHPHRRLERLDGEGDAADESAAAHRDQNGIEPGHLLQQLEADGALAGDDARVVERMDEDEIALGLDLLGAGKGLVVVFAVEDHLGALPPRGHHLAEGRPFGHDDDGRDAQPGGVPGHGQRVVAGAGGHDAPAALCRRELEQEVGGAALLEGARHLKVLELDEDARAGQSRQRLRVGARRGGDGAAEARPRRADVVDRRGDAAPGHGGAITCRRDGDWSPIGMKGVEWAQAMRPFQSTTMRPPWPRPSSTSTLSATSQAWAGSSTALRISRVRRASATRMMASPSPVHETPPSVLSAYVPQPMSAESPTRPGSLPAVPPEEVAAAMVPARSRATAPTVPGRTAASCRRRRSVTSSAGSPTGTPTACACRTAAGPAKSAVRPSWRMRRQSEIGLRMPDTAATAPCLSVSPSMMEAAISTVPAAVSTEPRPALKRGWSSSARTAASTASSARPPPANARQPASSASAIPRASSWGASPGSAPAPPWTMRAGTRLVIAPAPSVSWRVDHGSSRLPA